MIQILYVVYHVIKLKLGPNELAGKRFESNRITDSEAHLRTMIAIL